MAAGRGKDLTANMIVTCLKFGPWMAGGAVFHPLVLVSLVSTVFVSRRTAKDRAFVVRVPIGWLGIALNLQKLRHRERVLLARLTPICLFACSPDRL